MNCSLYSILSNMEISKRVSKPLCAYIMDVEINRTYYSIKDEKMKGFLISLLIAVLLGMAFSPLLAQQSRNLQKSDPEVEALKKRISKLEIQLQTVENVEKMELAAKLAEANAKLLNAEIDKFQRELKDANDEWLRTWSLWFAGIIGFLVLIVGGAFWFWLRSRADQLIVNSVEKSLNGFKDAVAQVDTLKNNLEEAVGQVNILQDQIRILEKEHAVSVLASSVHLFYSEDHDSEQIKPIPDRALVDLLADKTRDLSFRYKAAEVLVTKKSAVLVTPALELLNSVVDADFDWKDGWHAEYRLSSLVNFLGQLHTQESYEGLAKFLDRLLTENTELTDLFLTWTVFSLAYVSKGLNNGDSVPILRRAIPHLNVKSDEDRVLKDLAEHFDRFNEPEGIKEILRNGLADGMPDVEARCLELLEDRALDFVEEWKAQKEAANTQNEESS